MHAAIILSKRSWFNLNKKGGLRDTPVVLAPLVVLGHWGMIPTSPALPIFLYKKNMYIWFSKTNLFNLNSNKANGKNGSDFSNKG